MSIHNPDQTQPIEKEGVEERDDSIQARRGRLEQVLKRELKEHRDVTPEEVMDKIEARAIALNYTRRDRSVEQAIDQYFELLARIPEYAGLDTTGLKTADALKTLSEVNTIFNLVDEQWEIFTGQTYWMRKELAEDKGEAYNDPERDIHIGSLEDFLRKPISTRRWFIEKRPELQTIIDRLNMSYFVDLQSIRLQLAERLKADMRESPKEVFAFLTSADRINDQLVDFLLDINVEEVERVVNGQSREKFGREQYYYQGTPYELIRSFVREAKPSKDDTVYDLGSGLGRIVFYGGLTTEAKFKGIELAEERVDECNRVKDQLKLKNAEFIAGNILEQDYSDGTIFFLFNPFSAETLREVGKVLEKIARKKKIKIATWGPSLNFFENQKWLERVPGNERKGYEDVVHFESK